MSNPVGRPFQIDWEDVKVKMLDYVKTADYPTIANFCRTHDISRTRLFEMCEIDEELANLREKIKIAREDTLERRGLEGEYNSSMAKFALAQIGWSEKVHNQTDLNIKDSIDLSKLDDNELRKLVEMQCKSRTSET